VVDLLWCHGIAAQIKELVPWVWGPQVREDIEELRVRQWRPIS